MLYIDKIKEINTRFDYYHLFEKNYIIEIRESYICSMATILYLYKSNIILVK